MPMSNVQVPSETEQNSSVRRKSFIGTFFGPESFRLFGSSENISSLKRFVHLMDDRCITIEFTSKTLGRAILQEVCKYLDVLSSMPYFGIRYTDNNDLHQWLDLDKKVYKQIKDIRHEILSLRVNFYPPNPLEEFRDPTSKHLFYLQLRRDFYIGRLRATSSATYSLAAHAIQADHGLTSIPEGLDLTRIPGGMRILPNIPPEVLKHIRCHLTPLLGMSQTEAKDEFIRQACEVETYGMEPFQVMDQFNNGLCIGFNHIGISAFKNGERTDVFHWKIIKQVQRSKKHLVIVVPRGQGEVRLGFKCYSIAEAKLLLNRAASCKHFVRCLVTEQEKTCLESYTTSSDKTETELNCQVLPNADLEFESDFSQSSEDDTQTVQSSGERHLMVAQPASSRFPPTPRHSVTVPLDPTTTPSNKYLNVPRKSFAGSMELQTVLSDRPPQITEIIQLRGQRNHYVTRSSINIADEEK
ncbi:hypothetical protein P879_02552 [Paragonimus westermani]|uniref:FERM domain-containing protein n=1 Tax=Paragonimus westermani TaxID=34504 RepID=A0A8T0DBD0_9TREM|nr:hypothetical protein P879_02552 [Paragonimus westermani]